MVLFCSVFQYGLKKKVEEGPPIEDPASAGRVGRQKKTPEQLAAEANADSDDEQSKFSSLCCCLTFI